MKFKLTIDLGNDAMQEPADVSPILDELARLFYHEPIWAMTEGIVKDINGNFVGEWKVTDHE